MIITLKGGGLIVLIDPRLPALSEPGVRVSLPITRLSSADNAGTLNPSAFRKRPFKGKPSFS